MHSRWFRLRRVSGLKFRVLQMFRFKKLEQQLGCVEGLGVGVLQEMPK